MRWARLSRSLQPAASQPGAPGRHRWPVACCVLRGFCLGLVEPGLQLVGALLGLPGAFQLLRQNQRDLRRGLGGQLRGQARRQCLGTDGQAVEVGLHGVDAVAAGLLHAAQQPVDVLQRVDLGFDAVGLRALAG